MPLEPGEFFPEDTVGAVDTLVLTAADPSVPTAATIDSAFYGVDASGDLIEVHTIADDRLSVTFTVLPGIQNLEVNLLSPDPQNELINLSQGTYIVAELVVRNRNASTTITIQGLEPAEPAAGGPPESQGSEAL